MCCAAVAQPAQMLAIDGVRHACNESKGRLIVAAA